MRPTQETNLPVPQLWSGQWLPQLEDLQTLDLAAARVPQLHDFRHSEMQQKPCSWDDLSNRWGFEEDMGKNEADGDSRCPTRSAEPRRPRVEARQVGVATSGARLSTAAFALSYLALLAVASRSVTVRRDGPANYEKEKKASERLMAASNIPGNIGVAKSTFPCTGRVGVLHQGEAMGNGSAGVKSDDDNEIWSRIVIKREMRLSGRWMGRVGW